MLSNSGNDAHPLVEDVRGRGLHAPVRARIKKLIPTVPISEICPELPPVEMHAPIGVDGNVSLYELVILIASLAKQPRSRSIFRNRDF